MEYLPPQNTEAEKAVLGAIPTNPEALLAVQDILVPEDFYHRQHALIYEAAVNLFTRGLPVDMITVADQLKARDSLSKTGGITYIARLPELVADPSNAAYYAEIVREKALARLLIQKARLIMTRAYSGEYDGAEELLSQAEGEIFSISAGRARGGFTHLRDILLDHIPNLEKRGTQEGLDGLSSGFKELDLYTSGFKKGDLIILAGRPGMGKTSLAVQIAAEAALAGHSVALISCEMSRERITEKLLINKGQIDSQRMRLGLKKAEDWEKLSLAASLLAKTELYIDESPSPTIPELRSRCLRLKAQKGLELVVVDYLQLLRAQRRAETRSLELGTISAGLKALAKELAVPVIALSQLSREVEHRANKRPLLSDLRESGSLEQDADLVLFLYREEYYNPDTERTGETEIMIAKQREGPTAYRHRNRTIYQALCSLFALQQQKNSLLLINMPIEVINLKYKRNTLTPLQVFEAIQSYNIKHGFAPSVRELGNILGVTSSGSVYSHINRLKEMGWITSEPHKARSIRINTDKFRKKI